MAWDDIKTRVTHLRLAQQHLELGALVARDARALARWVVHGCKGCGARFVACASHYSAFVARRSGMGAAARATAGRVAATAGRARGETEAAW